MRDAWRAVVGTAGCFKRRVALLHPVRSLAVATTKLSVFERSAHSLDGAQVGALDHFDIILGSARRVTTWLRPVATAVNMAATIEFLFGGHDNCVNYLAECWLQFKLHINGEGFARCHPVFAFWPGEYQVLTIHLKVHIFGQQPVTGSRVFGVRIFGVNQSFGLGVPELIYREISGSSVLELELERHIIACSRGATPLICELLHRYLLRAVAQDDVGVRADRLRILAVFAETLRGLSVRNRAIKHDLFARFPVCVAQLHSEVRDRFPIIRRDRKSTRLNSSHVASSYA